MIAASALLFYEGGAHASLAVVGAVAGALLVVLVSRLLASRPNTHFEALARADARKAVLLVGVMTVHSFAEGVGVGVSFGGGESLGLVTALAIAIHNTPEGLAISLVLVPGGVRIVRPAGASSRACPTTGRAARVRVRRLLRRSRAARPRLRRRGNALECRRPGRPGRPPDQFTTGGRRGACWLPVAMLVLESLVLA